MKIKFIILVYILMLYIPIAMAQLPSSDPNYQLVFEDNFDGTSVNTSKWKSIWNWQQSGFPIFVNDSDCYLNQTTINIDKIGYIKQNYENSIVNNGTLTLISKKENYIGQVYRWPNCSSDSCLGKLCDYNASPPECFNNDYSFSYKYTTGMLVSKERFKYGYFEIRCKLPKPLSPKSNKGIGANFWLYGADDLVSWSEIDIFEFHGDINENEFKPCIHYEDNNGIKVHWIANNSAHYVDFSTFHTFGANWTPEKIDFYLDGNVYLTTTAYVSNLVAMPIVVDMNLPLYGLCQLVDDNITQLPYNFDIDYVRVYQLKNYCSANNQICTTNNMVFGQYASISVGGASCNVNLPSGSRMNLKATTDITLLSNVTVNSGAELLLNTSPCWNCEHILPTRDNSTPQPAPPSFYNRLNHTYYGQ